MRWIATTTAACLFVVLSAKGGVSLYPSSDWFGQNLQGQTSAAGVLGVLQVAGGVASNAVTFIEVPSGSVVYGTNDAGQITVTVTLPTQWPYAAITNAPWLTASSNLDGGNIISETVDTNVLTPAAFDFLLSIGTSTYNSVSNWAIATFVPINGLLANTNSIDVAEVEGQWSPATCIYTTAGAVGAYTNIYQEGNVVVTNNGLFYLIYNIYGNPNYTWTNTTLIGTYIGSSPTPVEDAPYGIVVNYSLQPSLWLGAKTNNLPALAMFPMANGSIWTTTNGLAGTVSNQTIVRFATQ